MEGGGEHAEGSSGRIEATKSLGSIALNKPDAEPEEKQVRRMRSKSVHNAREGNSQLRRMLQERVKNGLAFAQNWRNQADVSTLESMMQVCLQPTAIAALAKAHVRAHRLPARLADCEDIVSP